jgi:hypothetical protein
MDARTAWVIKRGLELGHQAAVEPMAGTRFRCSCSCGYVSRGRTSQREALSTVIYHLGKSVGVADGMRAANGVSPLPTVAGGL